MEEALSMTAQHALLLVPVELRLLNGNPSGTDGIDFQGSRPTKFDDPDLSPDNTTTAADRWKGATSDYWCARRRKRKAEANGVKE